MVAAAEKWSASMMEQREGARRFSLAATAFAAATALASASQALTIELKDVASDRVERQRAFAEGRLPLPGTPNVAALDSRLEAGGFKAGTPMFIRIFKAESELEIWMLNGSKFELFATYPICHWSGTLGPKIREGDKQNPEGFYSVTQRQLHRVGRWPRSLNLGFPNTFDRAFGRTGSYILVHGGCSSTGCFAMTNAVIEEIYDLTEKALKAGQERVHVHVFPFRMTDEAMERHKASPWYDFWVNLKEGYDAFEETRIPPRVSVCDQRYLVQNVLKHDGPEEVADPGPLALCGDPHAAIQSQRAAIGAGHPLTWWPPLHSISQASLLASLSQGERSLRASAPSSVLSEPSRSDGRQPSRLSQLNPSGTRARFAEPTPALDRFLGGERSPVTTVALPCNLHRASCRKWSSLPARATERQKAIASARLGQQVAVRRP